MVTWRRRPAASRIDRRMDVAAAQATRNLTPAIPVNTSRPRTTSATATNSARPAQITGAARRSCWAIAAYTTNWSTAYADPAAANIHAIGPISAYSLPPTTATTRPGSNAAPATAHTPSPATAITACRSRRVSPGLVASDGKTTTDTNCGTKRHALATITPAA